MLKGELGSEYRGYCRGRGDYVVLLWIMITMIRSIFVIAMSIAMISITMIVVLLPLVVPCLSLLYDSKGSGFWGR